MIVSNLILARSLNMVGADRVRSCKRDKQNSASMTTAAESNDDVIE